MLLPRIEANDCHDRVRLWHGEAFQRAVRRGEGIGQFVGVELRDGILPLRTGLFIKYPFPLCLCMVNGVRSAYQRRNTLGTTPEI